MTPGERLREAIMGDANMIADAAKLHARMTKWRLEMPFKWYGNEDIDATIEFIEKYIPSAKPAPEKIVYGFDGSRVGRKVSDKISAPIMADRPVNMDVLTWREFATRTCAMLNGDAP